MTKQEADTVLTIYVQCRVPEDWSGVETPINYDSAGHDYMLDLVGEFVRHFKTHSLTRYQLVQRFREWLNTKGHKYPATIESFLKFV